MLIKKKSHCKKFKLYRKAQRRKQKITLKCHTPKQPSLTLSEHHFRHLPMHEKMSLLSSLARRCTSEQFSSVPWVVISFKLGFRPVFAYYVPVYFFASVCLHNSPLFFIWLTLKWKAVFSPLFSLIWGGWILPPSDLPYLKTFCTFLRIAL